MPAIQSVFMKGCILALFAASLALWAQEKTFQPEALLALQRVSDPQLSPDGKNIAFTVQTPELESNKRPKQIYLTPLEGGSPKKLTTEGSANDRPRWMPDSKRIAFLSDRGGSQQVWIMDASGANARQLTRLSTEVSSFQITPDGKSLVAASDVYPDCADDACNQKKLDAEKASKTKARIITSLLYRHWTQYQGSRRSHLLLVPIEGSGPVKDLTPGSRDVPPFSLGGPDDFAIAPDSSEVCYALNSDEIQATSTNTDLWVVNLATGKAQKITINPGADASPLYSRDGKYIAYRAQFRGGYESDRYRLLVLERATGKITNLTEGLDRWVSSFTWSPDSSRLFFAVEDRGRQSIQFVSVSGGGVRVAVSGPASFDDMQFTPDGKTMVYTAQSGSKPVEIYRAAASGGGVAITRFNDDALKPYNLPALEDFTVESTDKTPVHSFVVKPPGFDKSKKYPVLMLIHGGPQGHWGESWTYRWNAQVFASAGFLVVMPNPRGSTGYGQKFVDEIIGDWGGRCFDDIMAVTDAVAAWPYADSSRMVAAGGSFGGYMVNWLMGHTDRFKAYVSHAGVFDLRSESMETEELWFPIWEYGGMPWSNPEMYQRWSPSMFVKEFRTPTLVIHGELDYRVPYGQGLQLFTALQLNKVPSKLLLFPDEGHWVLKPQNSLLWYQTFLDWIQNWTKK